MPEPPVINAKAWMLMDAETGRVLLGQNEHERIYPASLTKMMTSYIIGQEIMAGRLHYDDQVMISENAWSKKYSDSSKMFIKVGDTVSVKDLNYGIIIQSGNDACVAMAERIAGSQEAFADLMNQWADYLGMNSTHFVNAHGLFDENHYSTAYDLGILSRALIRDEPEEYRIYSIKEFTFNKIKQYNRNRLLWDNSLQFDGIKTGHLSEVGYNLVASGLSNENSGHEAHCRHHRSAVREGKGAGSEEAYALRLQLLQEVHPGEGQYRARHGKGLLRRPERGEARHRV